MSTLPFKPGFNALLALCRASNLPTVWMNVVSAAVLSGATDSGHGPVAPLVMLLALALSCFYCGGMALNDVCDLAYDSVHQRYRPIPAGRITLARARAVTLALFACALGCLLGAPYRAGFVAGVGLLLVISAYDYFHKRHPSTVLAMAGARLLVYVVTAFALTGAVAGAVWFVAVLQAGYVLTLTVVARLESHTAARRYSWPVIPWMLAAMPVIDGAVLAVLVDPVWLIAGFACAALTRGGQRYVRGD